MKTLIVVFEIVTILAVAVGIFYACRVIAQAAKEEREEMRKVDDLPMPNAQRREQVARGNRSRRR